MTQHNGNANGRAAERLDTLRRYAVDYHRNSNAARWKLCFIAGHIVGRYERGATAQLADDLGVTVDAVEDMAKAAVTFRTLANFRVVSEVKRALSPSHFAAMGELMVKHDISPAEAIEDLRIAAENRVPVRKMAGMVTGASGNGGVSGDEYLSALRSAARHIAHAVDIAPDFGKSESARMIGSQLDALIENVERGL